MSHFRDYTSLYKTPSDKGFALETLSVASFEVSSHVDRPMWQGAEGGLLELRATSSQKQEAGALCLITTWK